MTGADAKVSQTTNGDPAAGLPFKFLFPYITAALEAMDYVTAIFLAERLFYHYKPQKNRHSELAQLLLGQCYFRSGKPNCAHSLLKASVETAELPQTSYLFAQACFHLKNYSEAEKALLRGQSINDVLKDSANENAMPLKSQGYYLLGQICRRTSRVEQAEKSFSKCLKINSCHWGAYSSLCDLGVNVEEKLWFRSNVAPLDSPDYLRYLVSSGTGKPGILHTLPGLDETLSSAFASIAATGLEQPSEPDDMSAYESMFKTPKADSVKTPSRPNQGPARRLPNTPMAPAYITPPTSASVTSPQRRNNSGTGFAKPLRTRRSGRDANMPGNLNSDRPLRRSARISGSTSSHGDKTPAQKTPRRRPTRNDPRTKKQRSTRHMRSNSKDTKVALNPVESKAVETPTPQTNSAHAARGMAPIKRKLIPDNDPLASSVKQNSPPLRASLELGSVPFALDIQTPMQDQRDTKSINFSASNRDLFQMASAQRNELQDVLSRMAQGYKLLSKFKCKEAVEEFEKLAPLHYYSGWVLCCLGKCYFEMVNYPKSVTMFRQARKLEPYRCEGLEYYSTSLWHLKNEVELSYLAQSATEFDKLSPLTWIVVGNCLSLQKEHDTALKFFRRAIQLDPHSAWAYTLSAHEFVANEDFEKALCGFRQAIGVNPRHYNAWYGMGNIYFRQEKYELAAYHFQRALSINERNTVLYCYLGMVLHASAKFDDALENLSRAEQLEPTNSLAKYQKANVYFSLQQYQEALDVLQQVRDFAPREASVHFLMGKVCKRLGRINDAILHFTTTLDLNPKDKNVVKSAIDKLHCGDTESQSEDEF